MFEKSAADIELTSRRKLMGVQSPLADALRRSRRERHAAMSPAERVALASRLAEEGIVSFMLTQRVTRSEAIRRIKALHREGRRPSACAIGHDD